MYKIINFETVCPFSDTVVKQELQKKESSLDITQGLFLQDYVRMDEHGAFNHARFEKVVSDIKNEFLVVCMDNPFTVANRKNREVYLRGVSYLKKLNIKVITLDCNADPRINANIILIEAMESGKLCAH